MFNSPVGASTAVDSDTAVSDRSSTAEADIAHGGFQQQSAVFSSVWNRWQHVAKAGLTVDAGPLDMGSLLAIMYEPNTPIQAADWKSLSNKLNASVQSLASLLEQESDVYGATTAFGGNADHKSRDVGAVQLGLIKHLNSGFTNELLDTEFVRGAMVLRIVSVCRGFSAVRPVVIEGLMKLVAERVTPIVPLRGSISASGDLMPLSYIARVLMGRPSKKAATDRNGLVLDTTAALKAAGIKQPVEFAAKEALALVNGTSISCAVATAVTLDAHALCLLFQLTTAFSVEVLAGHVDAFDPVVGESRPHPGQIEVASNILHFLNGSKLANADSEKLTPLLFSRKMPQDRYSLRTSPQWLAPLVELLPRIQTSLETEMNSVTDNPIIDPRRHQSFHAGNFQAKTLTACMDSLRLELHSAAKLLFAQHSELLNSTMSQGLPPNLCWDDASFDFGHKGLDTSMAAYMSEVGHLAQPVSVHVQSAELHNQSVNSLALISARMTAKTVKVIQMMVSCHLYTLTQAADLRLVEARIKQDVDAAVVDACTRTGFGFDVVARVTAVVREQLAERQNLGWNERVIFAVDVAVGGLIGDLAVAWGTPQLAAVRTMHAALVAGINAAVAGAKCMIEKGEIKVDGVLAESTAKLYHLVRGPLEIPTFVNAYDHDHGDNLDTIFNFVSDRKSVFPFVADCLKVAAI
ncbi:L-Aspartase-like protein [Chytriomyces cf. hyalinus JEL632]|nr:L-Aspartase-like protein [Chytriomyces cf. hyalinus JEL632]